MHFRMEIPPDPLDELARIYAHAAVDAFLDEQFRRGDRLGAIARPSVSEVPASNPVAQDQAKQTDVRVPDP